MWPFKKKKNYVILIVDMGGYYHGMSNGKMYATSSIDKAMLFTKSEANNVVDWLIYTAPAVAIRR